MWWSNVGNVECGCSWSGFEYLFRAQLYPRRPIRPISPPDKRSRFNGFTQCLILSISDSGDFVFIDDMGEVYLGNLRDWSMMFLSRDSCCKLSRNFNARGSERTLSLLSDRASSARIFPNLEVQYEKKIENPSRAGVIAGASAPGD